jgi:hypothetical protein
MIMGSLGVQNVYAYGHLDSKMAAITIAKATTLCGKYTQSEQIVAVYANTTPLHLKWGVGLCVIASFPGKPFSLTPPHKG